MTPDQLAAIHQMCFVGKLRPWTAAEFADMAADPSIKILTCPHGFAVLRLTGPEAELLTLAIAPAHHRKGLGQRLMTRLEEAARSAGVEEIILDVAEDNVAATALYEKTGFTQAGYRRDYYSGTNAARVSAIVMRKTL